MNSVTTLMAPHTTKGLVSDNGREVDVEHLANQMDQDHSGDVSENEFTNYFSNGIDHNVGDGSGGQYGYDARFRQKSTLEDATEELRMPLSFMLLPRLIIARHYHACVRRHSSRALTPLTG